MGLLAFPPVARSVRVVNGAYQILWDLSAVLVRTFVGVVSNKVAFETFGPGATLCARVRVFLGLDLFVMAKHTK